MNRHTSVTQKSLEDFAEWLDSCGFFDGAPWIAWWDKAYCKKCPSIKAIVPELDPDQPHSCAYCEIHNHCKFFSDLPEVPNNQKIIELWLQQKIE